jgi:uncharacterized protein (TIGR00251 family)
MLVIQVKVKPNSRQQTFERQADGTYLALLKAPPVDGKANAELIALVAEHFNCRKAQVTIQSGANARWKRLKVDCDSTVP